MDGLVGVDSFPESAWKPRRNASTTCPKKKTPFPAGTAGATPVPAPTQQHPSDGAWGNSSKTVPKKKKKTLSQLCPGINPERLRVASTGGLSNALKVVRGGINPCGEADGEALPF